MKKIFFFLILLYTLDSYAQFELWSMTYQGGADGIGTIFKINPDGTGYTRCHDFATDYPGYPYATLPINATDGKLYGVTRYGGSCDLGVLFSFDTLTGIYSSLIDFDLINGAGPLKIVQNTNGKLYGITIGGGSYNYGTFFSYDISNGIFTKLLDFDNAQYGKFPNGIISTTTGKIYGTTQYGGSGNGVLYSFLPDSNIVTVEFNLDGTNGSNPTGSLIEYSSGKIYGTTSNGGTNGAGTVFCYDTTTHIFGAIIHVQWSYTAGFLMLGSNGVIYSNNGHRIFQIDPIDSSNTLVYSNTNSNKTMNLEIVQAVDGKIYGTFNFNTTTLNSGSIFQLDPVNWSITELYYFPSFLETESINVGLNELSPGELYGTTGMFFYHYNLNSNLFNNLFTFNKPITCGHPTGSLVKATNGKLYGIAYSRRIELGMIFTIDTSNYQLTMLYQFSDTALVHTPVGELVEHSNGLFYGMTFGDGLYNAGTIYSFNPNTHIVNILYEFDGNTGYWPRGSMTFASDGNLYGMTQGGGQFGNGALFRFNPDSASCTVLFNFGDSISSNGDSLTGSSPSGTLLEASNGKLYGTTGDGGTNFGCGVIFNYDLNTNLFTKLYDFNASSGYVPTGNLTEGPNGKLYGTTMLGGQFSDGTLFSIDTLTNQFSKLIDFQDTIFGHRMGSKSLLLASNGLLYGMTNEDGAENHGTIFNYDPINAIYTKLRDLSCLNTDGICPYSSFIEIPAITTGINNHSSAKFSSNIVTSPNPARDKITLTIGALKGNIAEIIFTTITGVIVFDKKISARSTGSLNTSIETGTFTPGIYIVSVRTEKENLVGRFVKM